jgi:hypothetical protein
MSNKFLALFFGLAVVFSGCMQHEITEVTVQEKQLPHDNPTSYDYQATIGDVQSAVKMAYGDKWREEEFQKNQGRLWEGPGDARAKKSLSEALQQSGADLLWKGDAGALSENVFNKPDNENDAYLYGGTSPVGESQIYFEGSQPLIYYADFQIHLTEIRPKETRVEIFTFGSRAITGLDESWSPHGPSFVSVEVSPTTIEQYQILLQIGQQLGTTNMPPLVTPGPDAPMKELTLPRER